MKVIKGNYLRYFAQITGDGYGRETELNYFEGESKWWVLKENDFDLRDKGDLKKGTTSGWIRDHIIFLSRL